MTWVRLDDQYDVGKDRVALSGRDAPYIHIRSLLLASRMLTDGHIPPPYVPGLLTHLPRKAARDAVAMLVSVGLWHAPGHDCPDCPVIVDGYYIHDYLVFQPSREQVKEERRKARERMAAIRRGVRPNEHGTTAEGSAQVHDPVPGVPSEHKKPRRKSGGTATRTSASALRELEAAIRRIGRTGGRPTFDDPALNEVVERLRWARLCEMSTFELKRSFGEAYTQACAELGGAA